MPKFLNWYLILFLTLALFHSGASGHATGENYIFLSISQEGEAVGHFEFHKDDLSQKLGIELGPGRGPEVLEKLENTAPKVHAYIREKFSMSGGGDPVELVFTKQDILKESDKFIQYHFRCLFDTVPTVVNFRHELMYENDRLHRGMVVLNYNPITDTHYSEGTIAMIFNRYEQVQQLDFREPLINLLRPRDFIWQGILHIWIGIDHILFLVVLLLPAVLQRKEETWEPTPHFFKASLRIVKIVTIFTVAHSVTLGLAALGYLSISGQFVESMIAASIILVAANNIFPLFKEAGALIIFAFGLFHGLGFASVMGELPFRMENIWKILIGFNLGVEIGQVAIVLLSFGLLYAVRGLKLYVPVVLRAGSAAAVVVATFWLFERAVGF